MAGTANGNRLLVEGVDERRTLPELLEANGMEWPRGSEPVRIRAQNGLEPLLEPAALEAELKQSNLLRLGIVADANSDPVSRWRKIHDALRRSIPTVPTELPNEGLVHAFENEIGRQLRIGVWMMPDNRSSGMLETFLTGLVPESQQELWDWTERACAEAKSCGAPFKDNHLAKARLHSWLAVQDPPGRQMHSAINERILEPGSKGAEAFVTWFRRLFEL